MAAAYGPIICQACGRLIATVSSDDDVPWGLKPAPITVNAIGCLSCQQFNVLLERVQIAHDRYTEVRTRRDNYGPKQYALGLTRSTRMELANWLNSHDRADEETEEDSNNTAEAEENTATQDTQQQQGTKRPRSPSPVPSVGQMPTSTDGPSRTASQPGRKRIKFAPNTDFHKIHRVNGRYHRTLPTMYQKGKWAPPEGIKYLDTSGEKKTYKKFLGYKMVRGQWLDVWQDSDDEKEAAEQAAAEKNAAEKKSGKAKSSESQNDGAVEETEVQDEVQDEETPRSARSARRARRNSGVNSPEQGEASGTNRSNTLRLPGLGRGSGGALERGGEEVDEPSESATSEASYEPGDPSHSADAAIYTEHYLPVGNHSPQSDTAVPDPYGDASNTESAAEGEGGTVEHTTLDLGCAASGASNPTTQVESVADTLTETTTLDPTPNPTAERGLDPDTAETSTNESSREGSTAPSSPDPDTAAPLTDATNMRDLAARPEGSSPLLAAPEESKVPTTSIDEVQDTRGEGLA